MAKGIEAATFANVVKDGERRTSQAGNDFATVLMATESGETDDKGKDIPIFIRVLAFGDLAEVAGNLKKGGRAYLEGSLSLGLWQPDNGATRLNATLKANRLEPMRIGRNKSNAAEKATGVATATKPPEGC